MPRHLVWRYLFLVLIAFWGVIVCAVIEYFIG
jgi:hypothetical protein